MKLEGKILEIEEGKEFFVTKEIKKNNNTYLYITEMKQPKNTNFYELKGKELFEITDDNLLQELLFEVVKD